jgi:hypothetical protein
MVYHLVRRHDAFLALRLMLSLRLVIDWNDMWELKTAISGFVCKGLSFEDEWGWATEEGREHYGMAKLWLQRFHEGYDEDLELYENRMKDVTEEEQEGDDDGEGDKNVPAWYGCGDGDQEDDGGGDDDGDGEDGDNEDDEVVPDWHGCGDGDQDGDCVEDRGDEDDGDASEHEGGRDGSGSSEDEGDFPPWHGCRGSLEGTCVVAVVAAMVLGPRADSVGFFFFF